MINDDEGVSGMGVKVDTRGVELDDAANRFLEAKKPSTAKTYGSCLRRFKLFYGASLEEFINSVEEQRRENRDLPAVERRMVGEDVIRKWIEWHMEVGYSPNSTRQALAALQNFMKYYQLPVSFSFIERPPARTLKENRKHSWTLEEVKRFVDSAQYIRDKAVMLCLFQSGLSIGDLVQLDYGDIRRELEEGRLPLMIHVYRKKTGTEFKTFLGRDTVHYLGLYLSSRQPLEDRAPLFTKLGAETRVTEGAIQIALRRIAEGLDFIDERDLENGWNPARPHSLPSFASLDR